MTGAEMKDGLYGGLLAHPSTNTCSTLSSGVYLFTLSDVM